MSNRIGASTEALSEYKFVAEQSNIEFRTLTMGWQRMTRRVSEAAKGFGEAKGALLELGLSAEHLNTLAPEDQFEIIADSINGLTNQADKVRLSMKLFDSEGVSLVQTMTEGSAGIREMRKEARDMGLTISRDAAESMATLSDNVGRATSKIKGMGIALTNSLVPALDDAINFWTDFLTISDAVITPFQAINNQILQQKREIIELQKLGMVDNIKREEVALERLFEIRADLLKQDNEKRNSAKKDKSAAVDTGPSDVALKAERDARAKLDTLKAPGGAGVGELEQLEIDNQARLDKITAFEMQKIELLAWAGASREEMLEAQAEAEMARQDAIEEHNFQSRQKMLGHAAGFFGDIATIASAGGKKGAAIAKKAAIVETSINTAAAAMAAYKSLAGIPFVGPALGAAAFAAAIVTGKGQIDAIKSGSAGGAGGGAATGSAPSLPGGPVPERAETETQPGGTVNLTVNVDGIISPDKLDVIMSDHIMPAMDRFVDRGGTVDSRIVEVR
jgi:hypothetical protein